MSSITPARKPAITNTMSTAIGLGLGIFPNLVPFVSLTIFFRNRISLGLVDGLMFAAALLLTLPSIVGGAPAAGLAQFLQLVGAWLLYRAFSVLNGRGYSGLLKPRMLALGLLAGLAILVVAPTLVPAQSVPAWLGLGAVWEVQSALYAHTLLTLGVLLATLLPKGLLRTVPLALSATGIVVSGNAESLLAWLVFAVLIQVFDPLESFQSRALEGLLLLLVALSPVLLSGPLWSGSATFAQAVSSSPINLNLLRERVPYWDTAVGTLSTSPLFGSTDDDFATHFAGRNPTATTSPNHAHNAVMQVLYSGGIVGLLGLFGLVLALARRAVLTRDVAFIAAILAILLANMFDCSLFYAGVLYPLASAAGWRSATHRKLDAQAQQRFRQGASQLSLILTDYLVAAASMLAAAAITAAMKGGSVEGWFAGLPTATFYILLVWPFTAWREGLYPGYGLTPAQELEKHVKANLLAGLLLIVATFLLPPEQELSRTFAVLAVIISTITAPFMRALVKRLLQRLGLWGRKVVILGARDMGQRVARRLKRSPLDGLHPIGFFDDDFDGKPVTVEGLPLLGDMAAAKSYGLEHGINHAIVAIPQLTQSSALLDNQGRVFRHMQFIPDLPALPAEDVYTSNLDGMLALEVRSGLYATHNRVLKRLMDLVLGFVGLVAALPALILITILIRLDSRGSAFYLSERLGEEGEVFHCLKFRTMYVNADERLMELLATDPEIRAEYEEYHKLEDDPRITRVGAVLRRLSLDELPQLVNVLRGELSLVGPRPYLVRELDDMGSYTAAIFRAKPGITGYWQVTGRSNVTFADRLEMESYYVRNWSIWWDIVILFQTAAAVLKRDGAT